MRFCCYPSPVKKKVVFFLQPGSFLSGRITFYLPSILKYGAWHVRYDSMYHKGGKLLNLGETLALDTHCSTNNILYIITYILPSLATKASVQQIILNEAIILAESSMPMLGLSSTS